jgi:hypothetical protein
MLKKPTLTHEKYPVAATGKSEGDLFTSLKIVCKMPESNVKFFIFDNDNSSTTNSRRRAR